MDLDKTDLSGQHKELVDGWETLFGSFGWQLILRRFSPRMDGTVGEMENAETPRDLGRIQGQRLILRELTDLERIVEDEFRLMNADAQAEPWGEV